MDKHSIEFYNKISKLSYNHYESLPKTGKPNEAEWTILSSIVKEDSKLLSYEVVALGTGSKCIGIDKMSSNGDILNDSHAEIMCRRSFMRFIYEELEQAVNNSNSIFIFEKNSKKFVLQKHIAFHLFTSHVPCGDASIFPKENCEFEDCGDAVVEIRNLKRTSDTDDEEHPKRIMTNNKDIFRTGAKCLPNSDQKDLHGEGKNYHVTGVVRTKPGRGSPTLSASCSDKLSKWCHLGIQGALLSILLEEPIYFESIIIGGGVPFCKNALRRALYDRLTKVELKFPYIHKELHIGQSEISFIHSKSAEKQPSPCSISWYKFMKNKCEVAVEGRRQGVTKKNLNKKTGRLRICKRELMECFLEISKKIQLDFNSNSSYGELKASAALYKEMWTKIVRDGFKVWPVKKSEFVEFSCERQK